MSHIDDELRQALQHSEGVAEATVAPPVARDDQPAARPHPKRSLGLLVALLAMSGGLLALVFTSFDEAAIYSKGVDELLAESARLADKTVRVQGILVKGSLLRRDAPCEYRFKMAKHGRELAVRYPQCVVPDTFREVPGVDVEVTAMGKLEGDGKLLASQIMAKCPSKYDMKERAARGEKAPHTPAGPRAPMAAQTY